ncbi:MAG: BTAD domain-containing putative transcriptional regulator [Caldimonas sp.]
MLGLKILGTVALSRDGAALALPVKKSVALLLLLARSGGPLPRARAAALLWPSLDEGTGRRNLRRELARLREAGAGDAVHADGDTLALADAVACDAAAFDTALRDGRADEALALWRGPPADGFALGDADAFDDWLAQQREQLADRRRLALRAAFAGREAAGDLPGALDRIEALLADNPLQEEHHRDAMRLLAATGRREAALVQYERCRALLRSELDLTPMAETEALAAALRESAAAPAPVPAPVEAAPVVRNPAADAQRAYLPEQLPFVGRSVEVGRLEAAWSAGRTIVVEGDGGVGKTRLATDFAAAHGPYALARCRPGDAELPYTSFTRALRALVGPALPDLPGWIIHELARVMPELGAAPPPIRSDEERNRFFEACARGWHALSFESFDAVVFDDWHFADAASRSILAFIAKRRSEEQAPGARELLVLRPELDEAASDALRTLIAATGAEHLRLDPLGADAVLELVRRLSGAGNPVRFAERLGQVTGGNPFFLAETLRHLVETELLSTDAAGSWRTPFDEATQDYRELPVPASVLETVLARVQRLPAACRRVLEVAALAAEPFAPALLAPACALSELDAVLAIEEAVAARLLREHAIGGFGFAHDLVQQALNGSLSDERRRLVHRRLALGAEAAGAPAATIATHHEASGDMARAVAPRIAAGDQAQRLHALPEAMEHWSKGLADGPTPGQALRLHERLIRVAKQRSQLDLVHVHTDALAALLATTALSPEDRVEAAISRALGLATAGRADQARAEMEAMPEPADEIQRARRLRALCVALHNLGRADQAMIAAETALALPSLSDAERLEMLDLAFLCDNDASRLESALARVDAALAIGNRIGDEAGVARGRFRRGILLLQLHDVAGAETEMLAAIETCERLGLVNLERVILYNLGCVYSSQSSHDRALATVHRGRALSPPLQSSDMRVMFRLMAVDAHNALGNLGATWQELQPAVEEAIAQVDPTIRIAATLCGLEPLGLLGEVALARRLLGSLEETALRALRTVAAEMWVSLAQFELKQCDPAAAERALAELDAAGAPVIMRARVRHEQARAELALAQGEPPAALALLPPDDAIGMNGEMRTRGLALRIAAEAGLGVLEQATVDAARSALAAPSDHMIATLELCAALAQAAAMGVAGAPSSAPSELAALVASLAETLSAYPDQQAAFQHAWRSPSG